MTLLPMLCSQSTAASGRRGTDVARLVADGEWMADVKLDGVRALARWDGSRLHLTNRTGNSLDWRFPEVHAELTEALQYSGATLLDGEIVANDGSFETTLLRDKQGTAKAASVMSAKHPCRFVAFDLLEDPHAPWLQRRRALEEVATRVAINATVVSDDPGFIETVRKLGLEGVVVKHKNAPYLFGVRSKNWIKARNVWRVTCIATSYTPGTGSRADFGAMELFMYDGNGRVNVGRCGTGFTQKEIPQLKKALDQYGILPVEIECANVTKDGALRFPVYKGIRLDVPLAEITIEQLEHLPRC